MMKNKIMMVLLLAGAGFAQDAQAMGGAKDFAKKVFCSKTAAVAGVVALGVGANRQLNEYRSREWIAATESSLPLHIKQEVRAHFEKLGIHSIEMIDVDSGLVSLAVFQWFGRTALAIPYDERLALRGRWNLKELTKEEVFAIMEHEASHLRHRDSLKDCVFEATIPGVAIMAGQAIRVTGANKKIAVGSAAVTWAAAALGEQWRKRQVEKRADFEVRPENAGYLASGLKKLLPSVKEQLIAKINKEWMKQGNPLYDELDAEKKKRVDRGLQLLIFIDGLTTTHPPVEERIAYSNERAVKFRKEKGSELLDELRGLRDGALAALENCSWEVAVLKRAVRFPENLVKNGEEPRNNPDAFVESYLAKIADLYQFERTMAYDERVEWRSGKGKEVYDLHQEFKKRVGLEEKDVLSDCAVQ